MRKPTPPKYVWDLKTPTTAIARAIGREKIVALQKPSALLDWGVCIVTWGAFVALWWLLATTRHVWIWAPAAALQALVVMCGFYTIRHDQFFHRRIAGTRGSYVIGVLTSQVMLQPYTEHTLHADHHVHVGWDLSEEFFSDLDKRWKRWLCLTLPGIVLMVTRKLRPKDAPRPNKDWLPSPNYIRRLAREKRLLVLSLLVLAVVGYYHPHGVLFGYVLPLVLFGPPVILARIVFQHGETDPKNPFHASIYYRTGIFSRVLFFWSLGDCHLAHHLFPAIPMYRCGKAADIFDPVLRANNVPVRSLFQVMKGFFIDGHEIRTRWSMAGDPIMPAASANAPAAPAAAVGATPATPSTESAPESESSPSLAAVPVAPESQSVIFSGADVPPASESRLADRAGGAAEQNATRRVGS